jgi:hypothetical protein
MGWSGIGGQKAKGMAAPARADCFRKVRLAIGMAYIFPANLLFLVKEGHPGPVFFYKRTARREKAF